MEKKKVLLIDMYGVIIKESKGYFIPYTFEHFEESEYERLTKAFRQEQCFTKAGNGLMSSAEFLSYLGYEEPEKSMKDYLENHLTLDEQFLPFAEKMKDGLDIVLLSNDVWEWSEYLTQYYQLDKFFQDKVISGKVKMRKPEQRIFSYTLERIGRRAEECIFVDNSVSNLQVAEQLGISTILFNRDKEEYNGKIVNDFIELETLLLEKHF